MRLGKSHAPRRTCRLDGGRSDGPERWVGSGNYGVLYAARHRRSGAACALERFHPRVERGQTPPSPQALQKMRDHFVREGHVLRALNAPRVHPNVVGFRDIFVSPADDADYLVMEWVPDTAPPGGGGARPPRAPGPGPAAPAGGPRPGRRTPLRRGRPGRRRWGRRQNRPPSDRKPPSSVGERVTWTLPSRGSRVASRTKRTVEAARAAPPTPQRA